MPEYTWTGRPPAGSVLDTTSSYYAGLKAAFLFNDAVSGSANGATAKNLVDNSNITLNQGSYGTVTWSPLGLVVGGNVQLGVPVYNGAGQYIPCTVVIYYKSNATSYPNRLVGIGSGGGGGAAGYFSQESDTNVSIVSYGGGTLAANVPAMNGNTVMTAVNSTAAGNTLYHNGVNLGTSASVTFTAAAAITIGLSPSSGYFNGTVEAVYVYVGRVLTDAEHAHLAAAPYAAIIPASGSTAATAFTLSGSTSGTTGVVSSAFSVTPNGTLGQSETVTLSDGGSSGVFTPSTLTFAASATAAQTFTYTPASVGAKTLTATASPALGTAPTAAYTSNAVLVVATAFTLSGPASGTTGTASTNFTVTPNAALGQAETVTFSDSGASGTFTPVTLSFANAATASQTFIYTPASVGAKTLTATASPALGTAPTAAYTASAVSVPATGFVSARVTNPRGCLPGQSEVAYLDISTANGATDADSLPTVTISLLNQTATSAAAPTVVRVSTGLYKISVPTPAGCTWCDDICVLGVLIVGGKTFNWVVEFSIPTVATDAAGGVILQASEHINEIPQDIASALLQYSLGEYIDPANPLTSALRLSASGLANSPISPGLNANQVQELNAILDGVNKTVTATAAGNAALAVIKADSLFSALLNRQKQRFSYIAATKSYQLLLDDGVTPFGPPISLSVDSNNIVTGR